MLDLNTQTKGIKYSIEEFIAGTIAEAVASITPLTSRTRFLLGYDVFLLLI